MILHGTYRGRSHSRTDVMLVAKLRNCSSAHCALLALHMVPHARLQLNELSCPAQTRLTGTIPFVPRPPFATNNYAGQDPAYLRGRLCGEAMKNRAFTIEKAIL